MGWLRENPCTVQHSTAQVAPRWVTGLTCASNIAGLQSAAGRLHRTALRFIVHKSVAVNAQLGQCSRWLRHVVDIILDPEIPMSTRGMGVINDDSVS